MDDPSANPYEHPPLESEAPLDAELIEPPWHGGRRLAAVVVGAFVLFVAGVIAGGEWSAMASGAWEVAPLAALAILAYLGAERWWAQPLATAYLALLVVGTGLLILVLTGFALGAESNLAAEGQPRAPGYNVMVMLVAFAGVTLAVVVAGAAFVPRVRQNAARVLPLDPHSFVHAVAFSAVSSLTLMTFVPLVVLSAPPVLLVIEWLLADGVDLLEGRGEAGMLRDELYGLAWLVPAAVIAVGYGLRRNFRECLERLGFVRPTWRQAAAGVGLAFVLVFAVKVLTMCIDELWSAMGWPITDATTFETLMAHFLSPVGAVVLGIVAGLGEELAVRGCLQPRLGIWFSNLFFTGLHALQYNWDALVVVFLIGLVLGVIRQKTNTTTSAITHGTYDFLLVVITILEIPWLSE